MVPSFPFDVPIMPSFSSAQPFNGWFYPTENIGKRISPCIPNNNNCQLCSKPHRTVVFINFKQINLQSTNASCKFFVKNQ